MEWIKKRVAEADARTLIDFLLDEETMPRCGDNVCSTCPRITEHGCMSLERWMLLEYKGDS